MGQFEAEAREVLLRRRRSLSGGSRSAAASDPAARWLDYDATPPTEPVRREIAEIDAALQRIDQGLYGTCQNCGGPLGLQRLRALPEARYCVACSGHARADATRADAVGG
jgi:hypothetical protein